jgi:soluble lytic murein transglycosylase-like protein
MKTDPNVPASPAGATVDSSGLATVDQVVELADQLSACADQIHARVMREIKSYKGKPIPEARQDVARALLDDEVVLRQRANGLYADAAASIVRPLGKSQAHIVALTADAAEKIRKIALIGDVTGLVGGLLALAGAAASGQAVPIIAALEKIRVQLNAIGTHKAAPKPPDPTEPVAVPGPPAFPG